MARPIQKGGKASHPTEDGEGESAKVRSIRFLYALHTKEDMSRIDPQSGLMYVNLVVNRKGIKTLLETRDTLCNLKVTKSGGQLKVVNLVTWAITGSSKKVPTKVRLWEGNIDYTGAPMDDFDAVMGLEFMTSTQAIPLPSMSCLMFQGECPGMVAVTILKGQRRTLW
ncbi:hypothetical protein GQ457_04G024060 [Hibiscus cannabinus]